MVDIIDENRRPTAGERANRAVGVGLEFASKIMGQREQIAKENEYAKELGLNISGIKDPKTRQKAIELGIQDNLKKQAEQRAFDRLPEEYKAQYDAKYEALGNALKGIGTPEEGEGIQGPQQTPQKGMQSEQAVVDNLMGFDQEEQPTEQRQQQPVSKRYPPKYSQKQIQEAGIVSPPEASRMQKHNDNIDARKRHDEELEQRKKISERKEVSESYKENKDFINNTIDKYEDSERREAILDRMDQLNESGEMSAPGIINALESLGMSPDWLQNPANQEFNKLSLDLLGGGTLQADYGSRVLQSEFAIAQQRIPELSQTKEGRKQISENIKAMLLPSRLRHDRLQYYLDKHEKSGEPLPHNLRSKIMRDIKPQLEEAYDKFKQRNGRYQVKQGTKPDDNSIEKYFYLSGKNTEKAIKLMKEDGYDVK